MSVSIATLMAKKAELDAELKTHAAEAMKAEFRQFFETNPECLALRWLQYTPYFNDGEPCEFGRNEISFKLSDTPADTEDDYGNQGFESGYTRDRRDLPSHKKVQAAVRALEKIDDAIYLIAFGDHAQVTVTREGFEIDEYSHD